MSVSFIHPCVHLFTNLLSYFHFNFFSFFFPSIFLSLILSNFLFFPSLILSLSFSLFFFLYYTHVLLLFCFPFTLYFSLFLKCITLPLLPVCLYSCAFPFPFRARNAEIHILFPSLPTRCPEDHCSSHHGFRSVKGIYSIDSSTHSYYTYTHTYTHTHTHTQLYYFPIFVFVLFFSLVFLRDKSDV